MKRLFYALLIVSGCSYTKRSVYVCDSKSATRYHYKNNCRGLNSCKHAVINLSLEEAKKRRKTLCKWEE